MLAEDLHGLGYEAIHVADLNYLAATDAESGVTG
jgi:hypothetical protein